jgi:hypothetical protein
MNTSPHVKRGLKLVILLTGLISRLKSGMNRGLEFSTEIEKSSYEGYAAKKHRQLLKERGLSN